MSVTPYMHLFAQHLHAQHQSIYENFNDFNQEGLDEFNYMLNSKPQPYL